VVHVTNRHRLRRAVHATGTAGVKSLSLVEKSTVGIVYPMLSRTNYTEWSAVLRVNLQATRLWEAVWYGGVEFRDDRVMLAVLLRVVPADIQAGLANKESACDAWELIHKIRIGADWVKEANMERLRQDFTEIKFKPGEGVEDFSLHIMAPANELRVPDNEVTDKEVIRKKLHFVPEKLEPVAISMETLLDLNSLSIEEAVGHLWDMEQRKKGPSSPTTDTGGHLLLTERSG
jgi:hypothetical protein